MLPVLSLIGEGRETIPECLPALAERFRLTPEEVEELLPSGKQTILANRAHWARHYLAQAGLVRPIRRGHYELTADGQSLLNSRPDTMSKVTLQGYPAFREWMERSRKGSNGREAAAGGDVVISSGEGDESTPEERIARDIAQIESALAGELLESVLALSPQRFERLIVDLLVSMGYGGGDASMGRAIGKSGDGGIDGIINEDALGLDAVYIQAKRYAAHVTVGRPDLQQFVGSLTGEGATKGVFVTTSSFSREARAFVERVQQRIVLIDGARLARLMILHDVGVRQRRTYIIRGVDEDYFSTEV